jgi:hypothetical protein
MIFCDGFGSNQGEDASRVTAARLQEALMKANPALYELHLSALNSGLAQMISTRL